MAQTQRTKSPLDLLQGMINGVLIETGKALRASNKEGGKSLSSTNNRLRSIIPSASENFHQALDDLECDIIRAKSVLLRDLEELRARRRALENPEPIIEEPIIMEEAMDTSIFGDPVLSAQPSPAPDIKEEEQKLLDNADVSAAKESNKPTPVPISTDPIEVDSKDHVQEIINKQQGLTPPGSTNETSDTKPLALGIDTNGIPNTSDPDTAELQNSANNSLFGIDNDEDMGGSDLNFDNIDFGLDTSNANTQSHDLSLAQSTEFDLSTFGQESQDFNMDSLQTVTDNSLANDSNITNTTKIDELLHFDNTADTMDLDLDLDMGGDGNTFNDLFFPSGDSEMEHAFDNDFFGVVEDKEN